MSIRRESVHIRRMRTILEGPPAQTCQPLNRSEDSIYLDFSSDVMESEINSEEIQKIPRKSRFLFEADGKWKVAWDMFIIVLTIWNVLHVPFDFAYSTSDHIMMEILETTIDIIFVVDIIISFRTIYYSTRTSEKVLEPKRIALNYIKNGRFFIDLVSSIPVDLLILMFNSSDNRYFSTIKIIKLTRLFRLTKLVSFIRHKTTLRSGLKMILWVMFLMLSIHLIGWFWYIIADIEKQWVPPKNLDVGENVMFTGQIFEEYLLNYYYSTLVVIGIDFLPTNNTEILVWIFLTLSGPVIIGIVIGQFTAHIETMTKQEREKNDEIDLVNTVLWSLRIKEQLKLKVCKSKIILQINIPQSVGYLKLTRICFSWISQRSDWVNIHEENRESRDVEQLPQENNYFYSGTRGYKASSAFSTAENVRRADHSHEDWDIPREGHCT